MQYSQKVMEHFMNPHNLGDMPDADGVGTVGNPVCGDVMKIFPVLAEEGIQAAIEDYRSHNS